MISWVLLCLLLLVQRSTAALSPSEDNWIAQFADEPAAHIEQPSPGNGDDSQYNDEGESPLKRARFDHSVISDSIPIPTPSTRLMEADLLGEIQPRDPVSPNFTTEQPTQARGRPQPKRARNYRALISKNNGQVDGTPKPQFQTKDGFWKRLPIHSDNELNQAFEKMLTPDRPKSDVSTVYDLTRLPEKELEASLHTVQDLKHGHLAYQYQKYYQVTIYYLYQEAEGLSGDFGSSRIGEHPFALVPLLNRNLEDYKSFVIPLDSKGKLFDGTLLLGYITDLLKWLNHIHCLLWNNFHQHLPAPLVDHTQDYQQLQLWLFGEIFNPEHGFPVLGKTKITSQSDGQFGAVQLWIIKLIQEPNKVYQISVAICGIWFKNTLFEWENKFKIDDYFWVRVHSLLTRDILDLEASRNTKMMMSIKNESKKRCTWNLNMIHLDQSLQIENPKLVMKIENIEVFDVVKYEDMESITSPLKCECSQRSGWINFLPIQRKAGEPHKNSQTKMLFSIKVHQMISQSAYMFHPLFSWMRWLKFQKIPKATSQTSRSILLNFSQTFLSIDPCTKIHEIIPDSGMAITSNMERSSFAIRILGEYPTMLATHKQWKGQLYPFINSLEFIPGLIYDYLGKRFEKTKMIDQTGFLEWFSGIIFGTDPKCTIPLIGTIPDPTVPERLQESIKFNEVQHFIIQTHFKKYWLKYIEASIVLYGYWIKNEHPEFWTDVFRTDQDYSRLIKHAFTETQKSRISLDQ